MPESTSKNVLHSLVGNWFGANARSLPWRSPECSAWEIMVSEFMLQQTPVVRVLPVWEEWMRRWPTPTDLAASSSGEAVRSWGRLGYPRRALRLHAAAMVMVNEHDGGVPASYDLLLNLPGVGTYTAAAIASFAFDLPATVIDTNIRRVHARAITGKALPTPSLSAAETRLATELMPDDSGSVSQREWNASVMELGALVCTARSPQCSVCPLLNTCAWVSAGKPAPDYIPKGQSWAGTDRQVRGAMMAILRESTGPVSRGVLLHEPVDLEVDDNSPPSSASRSDVIGTLHALKAPPAQLERALDGLLKDGLVSVQNDGIGLPL